MKRFIVLCIALAAGVLCGAEFFGSQEACPELLVLTIHNGKAAGVNCESARTPMVKTALLGDTLDVDIRTEFTGEGTLDFDIPDGTQKIRLFGCEYALPPPDHTAFFNAVLMEKERPSWPQSWLRPDEVQYALVLVSLAPDRKKFDVQIRYLIYSGGKRWKWRERNFTCFAADDGPIFELLKPEERERMGPGAHYRSSRDFTNRNGKLRIRLETTGCYYKYLIEKKFVFNRIDLPKPAPRPYTLFFLNLPFKEKYLEENQSAKIFKVKKSVAEFHALAEKLKHLRTGMTPGETAAVLGKPDVYQTAGRKGPDTKNHAFAGYFFLNTETAGSTSGRNLTVTLFFEETPDGGFRLREVY